MRFEELRIPSNIAEKLILVRQFVDENPRFHKSRHSFEELVDEIQTAISKYEKISNFDFKNCHISGPCLIDPTVKILPNTVIIGPCIIGENCIIGPNAYIRPGTILAPIVHLGFCAEVKESIIGSKTTVSHFSYIGNSLIGNNCGISAGVVFPVRRFKPSNVKLWIKEDHCIDTNCKKLGAVIGDNVEIGSHVTVMPGTYIGSNSIIWPAIVVAKYIPDNSLIKTERGLDRKNKN